MDQIPYIQSDLLTKIDICLIDHVHKTDSINRAHMQLIIGYVIRIFVRQPWWLLMVLMDMMKLRRKEQSDEGWHC